MLIIKTEMTRVRFWLRVWERVCGDGVVGHPPRGGHGVPCAMQPRGNRGAQALHKGVQDVSGTRRARPSRRRPLVAFTLLLMLGPLPATVRLAHKALNIWGGKHPAPPAIIWSGRLDSNQRPSAPKAMDGPGTPQSTWANVAPIHYLRYTIPHRTTRASGL